MNDDLYSSAGVAGRYVFSPHTNSKDRSSRMIWLRDRDPRKKAKGGSLDHWTLQEACALDGRRALEGGGGEAREDPASRRPTATICGGACACAFACACPRR